MADESEALESLRAAIDRFGRELAPQVVARARSDAVARATKVLADAMAHSILEHADPGATPARATEPAPRTEPAPPETDGLLSYIYGVAWAGEQPLPREVEGVSAGHPPFTIEHGSLSAIVSLAPLSEFGEEQLHENLNDVAWLERTARAHEAVLDLAIASTTVVPLRLCTLYRDEDHVREMLDRERGVFEDALRRLEGKTEWGVKMIAEPGALERAVAGADGPEPEGLSPGAAYMRERSRQAHAREDADRVAEKWAEAVHRRVASRAAEALLNPLQNPEVSGHSGDMLLNGVYLVDDHDDEAFRAEVATLADEFRGLGVSIALTGPWPPYNFVKGSIEAAR